MDDHGNEPVRLRIFRDEAQDLVPLDFGLLFVAGRGPVRDEDVGAMARDADLPTDQRSSD